MSDEITIILPFPPSSNTAYPSNQRGGRHLSKIGAAWKKQAALIIRQATTDRDVPRAFALEMILWLPDRRSRDIDNYIKLPKDALCECLDIDDDWTVIPSITVQGVGIDRSNPRCVLVIKGMKA